MNLNDSLFLRGLSASSEFFTEAALAVCYATAWLNEFFRNDEKKGSWPIEFYSQLRSMLSNGNVQDRGITVGNKLYRILSRFYPEFSFMIIRHLA